MKIPNSYQFTKEIGLYLATIEANKDVINTISIPIELEKIMRGQSILGSSIFSARIEGNTLTRREISSFSDLLSDDKNKIEVANIYRAIELVLFDFRKLQKIEEKHILGFHGQIMKNILHGNYLGKLRTEHEGIFDSMGNMIYEAPAPKFVQPYIGQLVKLINSYTEKSIPIRATLAHLTFENIHPFVDGNGRVGRLLQFAVLHQGGYGMKGLSFPEELIENNRQAYYRALETSQSGRGDGTEFVELMLSFLAQSSTTAKQSLLEKQKTYTSLDLLAPRRAELVQIIREHKMISLDALHRRFLKISPRLLSYDLKYLSDKGFIQKIGKTRGALYSAK